MLKKVSVNILLYNSREHLPACLEAVFSQSYKPLEVTVIDNASTDGGVNWVREYYPQVHIIVNAENRGFCGGHNQGIRASEGDYVLLLNPDTTLAENYVTELVRVIEKREKVEERVGAAMGKLYLRQAGQEQSSPRIIDSTGVYVTKGRRTLDRGHGQPDDGCYDKEEFCFGANGAALLVSAVGQALTSVVGAM